MWTPNYDRLGDQLHRNIMLSKNFSNSSPRDVDIWPTILPENWSVKIENITYWTALTFAEKCVTPCKFMFVAHQFYSLWMAKGKSSKPSFRPPVPSLVFVVFLFRRQPKKKFKWTCRAAFFWLEFCSFFLRNKLDFRMQFSSFHCVSISELKMSTN